MLYIIYKSVSRYINILKLLKKQKKNKNKNIYYTNLNLIAIILYFSSSILE